METSLYLHWVSVIDQSLCNQENVKSSIIFGHIGAHDIKASGALDLVITSNDTREKYIHTQLRKYANIAKSGTYVTGSRHNKRLLALMCGFTSLLHGTEKTCHDRIRVCQTVIKASCMHTYLDGNKNINWG